MCALPRRYPSPCPRAFPTLKPFSHFSPLFSVFPIENIVHLYWPGPLGPRRQVWIAPRPTSAEGSLAPVTEEPEGRGPGGVGLRSGTYYLAAVTYSSLQAWGDSSVSLPFPEVQTSLVLRTPLTRKILLPTLLSELLLNAGKCPARLTSWLRTRLTHPAPLSC